MQVLILLKGISSSKQRSGCYARQVLAQRPALLFLGGPPGDVQFALDRHNATLAGAIYVNNPCKSPVLLACHHATLAAAVRTRCTASIPAVFGVAADVQAASMLCSVPSSCNGCAWQANSSFNHSSGLPTAL
jgi:hypothetical protein